MLHDAWQKREKGSRSSAATELSTQLQMPKAFSQSAEASDLGEDPAPPAWTAL